MTKFYAIGHPATCEGYPAIAMGELALTAAQTQDNIEFALNDDNLWTTELVESTQGPVTVYELVPVGLLRDVVL